MLIWFAQYEYIGAPDGRPSHPCYDDVDNYWYLWPGWTGLNVIAEKCNIPEDELIILKLKYGG
jgi:hypothetical protein